MSRLVVVDARQDNFVNDSGGWDKVSGNVEHREIAGRHADSILGHEEFSRIVAEEAREE